MTELDSQAKHLIDAATAGDDPSAADKSRVRAKLFSAIAAATVGTAVGTVSATAKGAVGASASLGAAGTAAGLNAGASGAAASAGMGTVMGTAGLGTAGVSAAGATGAVGSAVFAAKLVAVVAVVSATAFGGSQVADHYAPRPTASTPSGLSTPGGSAEVSLPNRPFVGTPPKTEPEPLNVALPLAPAETSIPNRESVALPSPAGSRLSNEPSNAALGPVAKGPAPQAAAPEAAESKAQTAVSSPSKPEVPEPSPNTEGVRPASSPTQAASSVGEETALLRDAHAAIERGDGAGALVLLDRHAGRFPHAVLAEEREAERIFALCSLGRDAAAKAYGNSFLASHPRSPLAARVRQSCATKE